LEHIKHLPRDSAYVRSLQGEHAYWDEAESLLAEVLDAVERQTYYLLAVNGNEAPIPTPFPRPGAKPAEPQTVSLSDFVNSLGADDV
jgi:hypothetical protein